jgi:hypothetical protein
MIGSCVRISQSTWACVTTSTVCRGNSKVCAAALSEVKRVFGISGTSFAEWLQPGVSKGSITKVELVGKNSPQPDKQIHNNDLNNFGPAVGVSWSLPWWGKDKTILRAGYGVSFQGAATYIAIDGAVEIFLD